MNEREQLRMWLEQRREETLQHVGESCCPDAGHLYARVGAFDDVLRKLDAEDA